MAHFSCVFFLIMALALSTPAMAVIDCPATQQHLIPCVPFLLNFAPSPSLPCCDGVQNVADLANASKENLRGVCECLKSAAGSYPGINFDNAKLIPSLCHVSLNVTIDPNFDCNRF